MRRGPRRHISRLDAVSPARGKPSNVCGTVPSRSAGGTKQSWPAATRDGTSRQDEDSSGPRSRATTRSADDVTVFTASVRI